MKHYVYVVRAGKWIKVGVSHNVKRRIKTMQTGCPQTLRLITKFEFTSRAEAFSCEHDLHEHLKSCRLHGEWFVYKKAKQLINAFVNGHKVAFTTDMHWRAESLRA